MFLFSVEKSFGGTFPEKQKHENAEGVYISGKIGILDKESSIYIINSDLVLDSAIILGKGKLGIIDSTTHNIYACKSSVQTICIRTRETKLIGDLRIEVQLVLEAGILDIREGSLVFGDTARIWLAPGSRILALEREYVWSDGGGTHKSLRNLSGDCNYISSSNLEILFFEKVLLFQSYLIKYYYSDMSNIELPPKV